MSLVYLYKYCVADNRVDTTITFNQLTVFEEKKE